MAAVIAATAYAQPGGTWLRDEQPNLWNGSGAPAARIAHVFSWTGTHVVVWGGHSGGGTVWRNDGGFYDTTTDSWLTLPNFQNGVGAPIGRRLAVGCWTGGELIVWGGMAAHTAPALSTGGMYQLATDTWLSKPNLQNGVGAPREAYEGFAAWTGERMIVFGGYAQVFVPSLGLWLRQGNYQGGVYDPTTDTWEVRPILNNPMPPNQYCGGGLTNINYGGGTLWLDGQLYVRGGYGGALNPFPQSEDKWFSAGGVYDFANDVWRTLPNLASGLNARSVAGQCAVWTGETILEFGGADRVNGIEVHINSGTSYVVSRDQFENAPNLLVGVGAPAPRNASTYTWTGSHFAVWGGAASGTQFPGGYFIHQDGGLYDSELDQWSAVTVASRPMTPLVGTSTHWNGSTLLGWGGWHQIFGNPVQSFEFNTGFVYLPPRVAPTIRNLSDVATVSKPNGDVGASAANPLRAKFGESFKHRIVCYGTPEAAVITHADKPWWMNIGWGGPGPLVAHGTGQGNGGQGGAPLGTGAPFHPWFSANGGTADGQWIRGTPAAWDTGLHEFTVHAHNGIFPDTGTKTVFIEIEGPAMIVSTPTTYANGRAVAIDRAPYAPGPYVPGPTAPPAFGVLEAVALVDQNYFYMPEVRAIPSGLTVATATWIQPQPWSGGGVPPAPVVNQGFPAWLAWDGTTFSGTPSLADEYQTISIDIVSSNVHGSSSQSYTLHVLPARPSHPAMRDVNGDGSIDVIDLQALVNIILFGTTLDHSALPPAPLSTHIPHPIDPPPATALRGDVTLNFTVDIVDVQALVNGILGR